MTIRSGFLVLTLGSFLEARHFEIVTLECVGSEPHLVKILRLQHEPAKPCMCEASNDRLASSR